MEGPAGTKACPIDFDHESAAHAQAWPEEFAQMRESCPVAWTGHHGGYWVATSYEAVVGVARDAKLFSSEKTFDAATGTGTGGITIPFTPIPRGLPVEADRPEWDSLRGLINRKFAPKAVETFRAGDGHHGIDGPATQGMETVRRSPPHHGLHTERGS